MVSAIEEKKKTKIDTKKERITNDWGKFVKSIFHNLVTTLLIVLLVCNSIFYSQSKNLDLFFPTDISVGDELPTAKSKITTQQNGVVIMSIDMKYIKRKVVSKENIHSCWIV